MFLHITEPINWFELEKQSSHKFCHDMILKCQRTFFPSETAFANQNVFLYIFKINDIVVSATSSTQSPGVLHTAIPEKKINQVRITGFKFLLPISSGNFSYDRSDTLMN